MPFIPVPNTVLAEMRFQLDGQQIENTLYFENPDSPPSTGQMTGLGTALITWWTDNLATELSASISLREVKLTDLTTDTSPAVTVVPGTPPTGLIEQDALPNNCAICVSFRTAGRGRSNRGRNYVPGLPDTSAVGSLLFGGTLLDIQAAYAALIGVGIDNGMQWVVVSRYHNKLPRVTGVTEPITAVIIVDNVMDSQRRRLPGRGR